MRFTLLSEAADGLGLALRLKAEGNSVKMFVRETDGEGRGKGIIDRTEDPQWGSVLVADCTGLGLLCDKFMEHGAKVVGGSSLADRLETDRDFANDVMRACGIQVPESQSFNDWDAATQFIAASEKKLVFKPAGVCSGVVPSYVPSDNEELLESIEHFKALCGAMKPEFTLQEFIEGTALSTEAWFDGDKFIRPFNHTIERKHFMDGDIGPSGGCTGNLVWLCDDSDPIVSQTVLRLERFLRAHQYRGAIDVNAVVNEEGVWGLEFTPRFGYDAFPTFLYSLYVGEFGRLLWQLAHGQGPDEMEVADLFGAGVRLSIPPWPSEKFHAEEGIPIRGLKPEQLVTDFYPYDVQMQDGKLSTSGGYGIVGVMNANGKSAKESFENAYAKLKKVKVTDGQFRQDLEEVCLKDYRKLRRIARNEMSGDLVTA
jgi:phosphoribosylamine--glycine ligase